MKNYYKNVLVAGGSGFVGTNIISKIYNLNFKVTATYNTKENFHKFSNVDYKKVDFLNKKECDEICKNKE